MRRQIAQRTTANKSGEIEMSELPVKHYMFELGEDDPDFQSDLRNGAFDPKPAAKKMPATFTNIVRTCEACGRRYRLTREALDAVRESESASTFRSDLKLAADAAITDEHVADWGFEYCLGCVVGDDEAPAGEYDVACDLKCSPPCDRCVAAATKTLSAELATNGDALAAALTKPVK